MINKTTCFIWLISLLTHTNSIFAEPFSFKVGIYGISDHFNESSKASRYTEQNYGVSFATALHSSFLSEVENELEFGAFRNSFDDLAVWVGTGSFYSINDSLDIGINAYHWYTHRNTYEKRMLTLYPAVRFYLNKDVTFKSRISESAIVGSLEIIFR